MALGSAVPETSRAEQRGVARFVTVRVALMLGVLSWRQDLVTLLTFQTHGVPVFAKRRLLLGEVDFFLTARTLGHDDSKQ